MMDKQTPTRHRFTLTIEQSNNDRDYIERRLRALLKFMLRAFGFRCVSVEPVKQETQETNE